MGQAAHAPVADVRKASHNGRMACDTHSERYSAIIDASVTSKELLFSRITDTAYLGYSSFSGWDGFRDLFWSRLELSDIVLDIDNRDLSALPAQDRSIWLELLNELRAEFPVKLRLVTTA
jgi:hypothetical protein